MSVKNPQNTAFIKMYKDWAKKTSFRISTPW